MDESFFLGGVEKPGAPASMRAHILFDGLNVQVNATRTRAPSVNVTPAG